MRLAGARDGFHLPYRPCTGVLDYPPELAHVPSGASESFAGVTNPFSLGRLHRGERVGDLGCGAGTDTLIAAQMVGPEGRVTRMTLPTPAPSCVII